MRLAPQVADTAERRHGHGDLRTPTLRISKSKTSRGSDVRSQNFCIRVPRRSIPELSETQSRMRRDHPTPLGIARSTAGQVRRALFTEPLSSIPSADQTSAKGRPSKDKNPPRLVARFVDRMTGIFLSAWKIKIFPGLWADLGSTSSKLLRAFANLAASRHSRGHRKFPLSTTVPQRGTTMATIRKRRDTYEVQAAVPDFRTLPDLPCSQVRSGLGSADGGRSYGE
jgi:hypothetical protein